MSKKETREAIGGASVSEADRQVLRSLAHRYAQLAHSEKNLERVRLWKLHNALRGERPMVHVEVDTFAQDVVTPTLACTGKEARGIEFSLRSRMICLEEFDDDWVVPPYFPIGLRTFFVPFGIRVEREFAGNSIGHHFKPVIRDLERDFEKLGRSEFGADLEGTQRYKEFCEELFGDILPCRIVSGCGYSCLTQDIVHIMSMEDMFCAMLDTPELFERMIGMLSEDYNRYFDFLEEQGLLLPTTEFEGVAQGSLAFTEELSAQPRTTRDLWGFMDSQETVGISPELFGELVFPAYQKVAERFGLFSYGCCEPTDPIWEYLSRLENLRKVSVSPWCKEDVMGERLRGSRVIFHRKPSPNYLGVGNSLDEEAFREHIRKTLRAARGCELEITQRDVYQVPSAAAVGRYVEVIRQEIESFWQP